MNRLAGIIVAAIGLLVAVLSILKVIPSLTWTGVALLLLGGLVIGLSFIDKPVTEGEPRMSTPATLAGVFFSPGAVFQNLRRHPRWLVAVLIASVLSALYLNAFIYRLTPEKVANYTIDKTLEMPMLDDNARKAIEGQRAEAIEEHRNPVLRTGKAVNGFVGTVFATAFLAGVFLLFALAMGGKINFWQAFATAAYSLFAVGIIRILLSFLFLFIKDPADIHPIIGQSTLVQDSLNFLVSPAENPVIYVLLGSLGVLTIYWIILNIIGLKNAGERISGSVAAAATITVWLVGVLLTVIMAWAFPSFLS